MRGSLFRNRIIKVASLALIIVFALLLCGCRSRLTNLQDANDTITDDGYMLDSYEWRREDLGLTETQESLFSGLNLSGGVEDDEYDEYDEEFDGMMEDYSPEEDDYTDAPETDTADEEGGTGTGTSTARRPGSTGRTGTVRRPVRTGTQTNKTKTVTVSFDANGGEVYTSTKTVVVGKTYGSLPLPERDGYAFEAWYTDKDAGDKVTSKTKVENEDKHTLYAHWKELASDSFNITFDPNGGTIMSGDPAKVLRKGDAYGSFPGVSASDEMKLQGYKLAGWFTQAEGGTQVSESDKFEGGADQTLFAQWQYDAPTYWTAQLGSVVHEEEINCYIELADGKTTSKSTLLGKAGLGNIAGSSDKELDMTEVLSRNPSVIVKVVKDMEKAEEERTAIADKIAAADPEGLWQGTILIVPEAAESGSDNEKLYYPVDLLSQPLDQTGNVYFTPEEVTKAAEELGVTTPIYR